MVIEPQEAQSVTSMPLPPQEVEYFGRHLALPNFGMDGQRAIREAHVVVIGAGGLGSSCIIHLASAGIGRLSLVDFDVVEFSNLHRQVIYGVSSLGRPKAEVAAERCADLNPFCNVKPYVARLDPELCDQLFSNCSLIVDCVDNLPTRLLICDGAAKFRKPVVSGSALRTHGQLLKYNLTPDCSDSYRTLLYPDDRTSVTSSADTLPAQNCNDQGVLGPIPGLIGTLMALEVIKLLQPTATADAAAPNFYTFNWLAPKNNFKDYTLRPKGRRPTFDYMLSDYDAVVCPAREKATAACQAAACPAGTMREIEWAELLKHKILIEDGVITESYCGIDVRPKTHSDIWTLKGNNIAYPLDSLKYDSQLIQNFLAAGDNHCQQLFDLPFCGPMKNLIQKWKTAAEAARSISAAESQPVRGGSLLIFCKRGVSSKQGVQVVTKLLENLKTSSQRVTGLEPILASEIFNVNGGVMELRNQIPQYKDCPVL